MLFQQFTDPSRQVPSPCAITMPHRSLSVATAKAFDWSEAGEQYSGRKGDQHLWMVLLELGAKVHTKGKAQVLMQTPELIGYLASTLVFATFYMKTMMPLRTVAIASNVAFITYGYLGGMAPILILHVALLPLNLWRLHQTQQLVKRHESAWLKKMLTPFGHPFLFR